MTGRSSPIRPRSASGNGCATAISWPTCARGRTPIRSGSGNISTSTATCSANGSAQAERCNHDDQVLIFDVRGPQYRALLEKRFPTVEFHIGHHVEDAEDVIADIDVIVGLGHHIPAGADRQGQEAEMGAGADHGHRDADGAGRAAAARAADLDARHPRPADERACVSQHDRAGAKLQKKSAATRPRQNGSNGASRSSKARPSSSSAWAFWPSIWPSAASCSA